MRALRYPQSIKLWQDLFWVSAINHLEEKCVSFSKKVGFQSKSEMNGSVLDL